MSNNYFDFKQFRIIQENSAFKVGTDGVLLGAWCDVKDAHSILDIGCCTGLIALMTAQRSSAALVAVELDKPSAAEAAQNISASPWSERISVIESDINNFSRITDRRFDHIVSNPPYFTNSLLNPDTRLSKARHTSELSTNVLLIAVNRLLSDNGKFSLVLPYSEANIFVVEAVNYGLYCSRMLKVKPLPSSPVKRILMEFSRQRQTPSKAFLIIETGKRHEYSHEYRQLTKDFYLDF